MKILIFLFGIMQCCGAALAGDFTNNLNGTVTDNITGLMWQQENDDTARNWEGALVYCEGLSLGGKTDWRLPNNKELVSITEEEYLSQSLRIDSSVFLNNKNSYWSSTTLAGDATRAWPVNLLIGHIGMFGTSKTDSYSNFVRCVRGGF